MTKIQCNMLPRRLAHDKIPDILTALEARGYDRAYGVRPLKASHPTLWTAPNVVWLLHYLVQQHVTRSEYARRNRYDSWELSNVIRRHLVQMLATAPDENVPGLAAPAEGESINLSGKNCRTATEEPATPSMEQPVSDPTVPITTTVIGETMVVTCVDQTMYLPRASLREAIINVEMADGVPILRMSIMLHPVVTISPPRNSDSRIVLAQFNQLASRLCQFAWENTEPSR